MSFLHCNPWRLTPRQIVVMEAVIRLGISKEVARELGIETKAVENFRANISKKMNAPMLVAAVRCATWKAGA